MASAAAADAAAPLLPPPPTSELGGGCTGAHDTDTEGAEAYPPASVTPLAFNFAAPDIRSAANLHEPRRDQLRGLLAHKSTAAVEGDVALVGVRTEGEVPVVEGAREPEDARGRRRRRRVLRLGRSSLAVFGVPVPGSALR